MSKPLFRIIVVDWMPKDAIWMFPPPPEEVRRRGYRAIKKWLAERSCVIKNIDKVRKFHQQEVG